MTEKIVKEYFEGIVSADALINDLIGTVETQKDTSHYKIVDYKSDEEFIVTSKHLIKLCNDVLNENININDLTTLAFALEASDYFIWDTNTKDGERVGEVIFNWSSPEISTPLTKKYVMHCAYFLETGTNKE